MTLWINAGSDVGHIFKDIIDRIQMQARRASYRNPDSRIFSGGCCDLDLVRGAGCTDIPARSIHDMAPGLYSIQRKNIALIIQDLYTGSSIPAVYSEIQWAKTWKLQLPATLLYRLSCPETTYLFFELLSISGS